MTRRRIRPAYTPEQLAKVYATEYNSQEHPDHRLRIQATAAVASWFTHHEVVGPNKVRTIADLSCGDQALASAMWRDYPPHLTEYIYGDITPSRHNRWVGPIEKTITQMAPVDLFLLSETLEHLDDPDLVLARARKATRYLVLSTPLDEQGDDNWEHYWAWGRDDIQAMLHAAGFTPVVYNELCLPGRTYDFQIWGCI